MKIEPIGEIRTPFQQKFGIPRQPFLATQAKGVIQFFEGYRSPECFKGLDTFDHLWLIFGFHKNEGWSPLVRPPRLGGNQKMGVFATRSSFRPNNIGLSVVRILNINPQKGIIEVSGVDLLDQTPIFDIKPYLPIVDSYPSAKEGWVGKHPDIPQLKVIFDKQPCEVLKKYPNLKKLLEEILSQDPRPAYKDKSDQKIYAHIIDNFDIKWVLESNNIKVFSIVNLLN